MKRIAVLILFLTCAACRSYPDGSKASQVAVPTPLVTEALPNEQARQWALNFITQKFIKYSNQSNQVYTLRHAYIIQIDDLNYEVWNSSTRPTPVDLKNDIDWVGYFTLHAEAVRRFSVMNECWTHYEEWQDTASFFRTFAEILGLMKKGPTPGKYHVYFEMYREARIDPANPSQKIYEIKCNGCELYKDPTRQEVQTAVNKNKPCPQEAESVGN